MHPWTRRLAKYSRWLHIYTSMTSFIVVFFFAVTGWTLNHAERLTSHEQLTRLEGTLDPAWTKPGTGDVARAQIIEALRRAQPIHGTVAEVRVDDDTVTIAFKGPAYTADVDIERATGKYTVTETRFGVIALLNDLHKGRDTGAPWKWAIDVSAGLLTFVSLTGLVLIYFVHRHRFAGVLALVAGAILVATLYAIAVP